MRTTSDGEEKDDGQVCCAIATLGMFIIDTFRFEDPVTRADLGNRGLGDQIGGGGTYFALGARVWLKPSQILMTVDRGDDFSPSVQESLDKFAATRPSCDAQRDDSGHRLWRFRTRRGAQTTRAVNIYRGEYRGFAYLTPKLRLDPQDLLDERHCRLPTFIHCICSPQRAAEICAQVDNLQSRWPSNGQQRPRIVWEPIPDSAIHQNLDATIAVAGSVDVLSPNHEEAASLLETRIANDDDGVDRQKESIQDILQQLCAKINQKHGSKRVPLICIRSGALGALICTPENEAQHRWIPAYHRPEEASAKVIDVTGAGNAWLGGFTAGLTLASDALAPMERAEYAARLGSVSASFMIEQQGLPHLTVDASNVERWNGDVPIDRLRRMQGRR